jgi:DNA (cytosine-5)-methyltransferase 1
MSDLTFGSLFAGIGGIDLGLERAGMRCLWQVENDHYCTQVLEKHWPEVQRYGDIRTIDWSEVETPDLIAGGFPCPVVSSAARGRNNGEWLWPEFARAIGHLQPRYVLMENVAGLLRSRIGEVVGDLASLGYVAEWATIPASALGAPHQRARVWLVAYPHSDGEPNDAFYAETSELPDADFYRWIWTRPPKGVRVVDGLPNRMDRLRALGNAVVPQMATWIGKRLMEYHNNVQP